MESVDCIQVVEGRCLICMSGAVPDDALRNPRKGMVAAQAVTEEERSVGDMPLKDAQQLPGAWLCPVSRGGKHVPLALNPGTDA